MWYLELRCIRWNYIRLCRDFTISLAWVQKYTDAMNLEDVCLSGDLFSPPHTNSQHIKWILTPSQMQLCSSPPASSSLMLLLLKLPTLTSAIVSPVCHVLSVFLTETCWCESKPASIRPALVVLASLFFQCSFKTRIWTVRVHLFLYGMVLVLLQGWCVKSSDPHTMGMNSVPKEVIPGQVSVTHFIFYSEEEEKISIFI